MDRRKFFKLSSGAGITAGAAVIGLAAPAGASNAVRSYSGTDLDGWEMVVGDGIYNPPGQAPVALSDLGVSHFGSHSTLSANTGQRGVMAHNICFRRVIDDEALQMVHNASFEFRLPTLPVIDGWPTNAQTIEGGLFIWDGSGTRKDLGVGFQWLLNPWLDDQGELRFWHRGQGGKWKKAGYLEPDTAWHRMEFLVDPSTNLGLVTVDGTVMASHWVAEDKEGWGTETAARLQAEIISVWPGASPTAPSHEVEFRNWSWEWTPA